MACNLRCPECAIGSDMTTRKRGLLSVQDFDIIWSKVKHTARLVYLHKWGEPTMNPNLAYFISEVSRVCHSHVMTNGLLLTEQTIHDYCQSGLGSLIFSIDGVSQDVYEKYRIGGSCEQAWNNLAKARDVIQSSSYKTDLIAQFIVFRHNEHELPAFKDRCEAMGIRYHIRTAYIRFGSVDRPLDETLCRTLYSDPPSHRQAISGCPHLSHMLTITIDGSTILCSQDYDQSYNLGSLVESGVTLDSVWNSPSYKDIRKGIRSGTSFPSLCIESCMIYPGAYEV